jgi:tetratricopeptide (TPR) repeat protein
MTSLFNAGPRLSAPVGDPVGDPKRQAIASLRGYAYQLYVSALAWISLKQGERLFLEIAEDYAIAANGALQGVQVKDTEQSGTITINSKDVRKAIDGFIDLLERNKEYVVTYRFLTTSTIGIEQSTSDRVNGEAVLSYWRRAAASADVSVLRAALKRVEFSDRVQKFIDSRDDEALRRDLLQKIHWDCGRKNIDAVKAELKETVVEFGADQFRMPPSDAPKLVAGILDAVLDTILTSDSRRLVRADLLELFEKFTHISLPHHDVAALMQAMSSRLGGGQGAVIGAARLLEPESELPLPRLLTDRVTLNDKIRECLQVGGLAFVTGGTGLGKTLLARLASRVHGGSWFIVAFRDESAKETALRLVQVIGQLSVLQPRGIILDDLNEAAAPEVGQSLARLMSALRRQDILCIVTAYREPSPTLFNNIGTTMDSHLPVPSFNEAEVGDLITQAGGPSDKWAKLIYLATELGHPQLVLALIAGLKARSWPIDELNALGRLEFANQDLTTERSAVRRSLVTALDEESRVLLYRVSLLAGCFERGLALQLGGIKPPPLMTAGEKLDALIGPWIDQMPRNELRVSPLVTDVGKELLDDQQQQAIHCAAAGWLTRDSVLDAGKINQTFIHALAGKSTKALIKIALAVIASPTETRRRLSKWFFRLRFQKTNQLIYPIDSSASAYLRLTQLILAAEANDNHAILSIWAALKREMCLEKTRHARDLFKCIAYFTVLNNQALAGKLPNCLQLVLDATTLSDSITTIKKFSDRFENKIASQERKFSMIGFLFLGQIQAIRSVAGLAAIFIQLDLLPLKDRERLLAGALKSSADLNTFVNSAWIHEKDDGELDWLVAAERYLEMGKLAWKWGSRTLAMRCHIMRAVMLDEYGGDGNAAVGALDNAISILGADPIFTRARAKIHYRQKDHANALPLFEASLDFIAIDDPIERTYMYREAGISAAEVNRWADTRRWFLAAHDAAIAANSRRMLPMAIGLKADAAISAYKLGAYEEALDELGEALKQLTTLDPDESLNAAYCHRVLRHATLWIYGQMNDAPVDVDGAPAAMVAGMCSNPEPKEEIRNKPITHIQITWYLMAQAEIIFKSGNVVERALRERIGENSIPACEIMIRQVLIDASIKRLDCVAFRLMLPAWVSAMAFLSENRSSLMSGDLINPIFGIIPSLSAQEIQSDTTKQRINNAFLVFGAYAVLTRNPSALATLEIECRSPSEFDASTILNVMLRGGGSESDWQIKIARVINLIASRKALEVESLFQAGIWLLQLANKSNFGALMAPVLAEWGKKTWTKAITEQKFAFRLPAVSIPAIALAINEETSGLKYLANILLAASAAVSTKIGPDVRNFLSEIK